MKLARMNLNYNGDTLVRRAGQGDVAVVRLFLASGMSPDARDKEGLTPLIAAAYNGHLEAARLLAGRGADLNGREAKFGGTALIHAARNGHPEVVRMLLEKGANPEIADTKEGRTALLWAVRHNHSEVVRALLDRGARINAGDDNGRNALATACIYAKPETLNLLLERGGNEEEAAGDKPLLMVAAAAGRTDNVRLLLDNGADINARDQEGRTALMWAAKAGKKDTVKFLLEGGADADAVDHEGNRALEHAKSEDIMNLLFRAEKME
ncbi:MAG: ankyrin repeat domain-containing protein [Desulfitobacteriaceae bacterium]|nr:ankyrin repeat domain-containing protein [Desulfitobacteriaceae bacterium]